MSDAHTDRESEGEGDTIDTLPRENIPENAHISACGLVISDGGETLGKLASGGTRSSRFNPEGKPDENTSIAEGSDE